MGDRGDPARLSRRSLSGGSVHPAKSYVSFGKSRFFAVVHILCVARYEVGADKVLHGPDAELGARVFPPQSLAKYTGHPPRIIAGWRPAGFHGSTCAGSHTCR